MIHEPLVGVGEHGCGQFIAAWVLSDGDAEARRMGKAEIVAKVRFGIDLAVATHDEKKRHFAKLVDMPQWLIP